MESSAIVESRRRSHVIESVRSAAGNVLACLHAQIHHEMAWMALRLRSLLLPPNVYIEILTANHSVVSGPLVVFGIMLIHLRSQLAPAFFIEPGMRCLCRS
jgi:hypothetical protein